MPAIDQWTAYMLAGDFEHAWQETDRIEGGIVWNREDFTDRTVLLRNDHGLGDTIQFIRYAPLLKQRCRRLIAKARPILVPFLELFDCIDEVIPSFEPDPDFDVAMESTELPYVFRTTVRTIPCEVPYVFPSLAKEGWMRPQEKCREASLLGADGVVGSSTKTKFFELDQHHPVRAAKVASRHFLDGAATPPQLRRGIWLDRNGSSIPPASPTVGLVWAAGPWDPTRSVRLSDLQPLADIPDVIFESLQWGPEWIQAQNPPHGLTIHNASSPIPEDLIDTARRILQCDLIITVDTMVAHLAGALGKPVWMLLHIDSNWRWMRNRSDTPWYPTMQLFRQPSPCDWASAVKAAAHQLRNRSLSIPYLRIL